MATRNLVVTFPGFEHPSTIGVGGGGSRSKMRGTEHPSTKGVRNKGSRSEVKMTLYVHRLRKQPQTWDALFLPRRARSSVHSMRCFCWRRAITRAFGALCAAAPDDCELVFIDAILLRNVYVCIRAFYVRDSAQGMSIYASEAEP